MGASSTRELLLSLAVAVAATALGSFAPAALGQATSGVAAAAVSTPTTAVVEAPADLAKWRGWIDQGNTSRSCADGADRSCRWLGALELDDSGQGRWSGKFDVLNLSTQTAKARLPGDDGKWPARASVNGKPAAIGRDGQGPFVMVPSKSKASILFDFELSRSRSSALDASFFGMVSVKRPGQQTLHMDPTQPIELGVKAATAEPSGPSVPGGADKAAGLPAVRISRLVADAQVPLLTTRIKIENGGIRRLVAIDGAIPEGSAPVQMQGSGARLSGSALQVEAAPGSSIVTIVSRLDPSLSVAWGKTSSSNADVQPAQFVFVRSDERFRKVSAQGSAIDPKAIDPQLSFGALPAYELSVQSPLVLSPKEIERGGEDSSAKVDTQGWVDFAGGEVFFHQELNFTKSSQGWFEPSGGWRATQASSGGSPLIVGKAESGEGGRISTRAGMGGLAVGMTAPFSFWMEIPAIASAGIAATQSDAVLRLPPGWRAIGVFGAGHSDVGWFAALSLWDWFLLIMAVWVAKSTMGWRAGAAVFAAMALGRLFLGAPFVIFLPLLVATALHKHLPVGKFKGFAFGAVVLLALLMVADLAPYTHGRIQKTLHSVLEDRAQPSAGYTQLGYAGAQEGAAAMAANQAGIENDDSREVQTRRTAELGGEAPTSPGAEAQVAASPGIGRVPEPMAKEKNTSLGSRALSEGGSAASDMSKGFSSSTRAVQRAPQPDRVSVSGAQAGRGLPSWKAGISVPIRFAVPATSQSVAKVLVMPAWLAKCASIGSVAALWLSLGLIVLGAWRSRQASGPLSPGASGGKWTQGAQQ